VRDTASDDAGVQFLQAIGIPFEPLHSRTADAVKGPLPFASELARSQLL
jgi:hypothetical protein